MNLAKGLTIWRFQMVIQIKYSNRNQTEMERQEQNIKQISLKTTSKRDVDRLLQMEGDV